MTRRRTRAEVEMEETLQGLDPASFRYRLLSVAKDFKAIWVEMGELLTKVRDSNGYKEWGYASFEAYCRREVRIRQDTANKLTRSFSFVRDHEPTALAERQERELPPLDVVDLLSRAKERTQVPDEQLDTIREEVFHGDGNPSRQKLMKRFREIDPEAFRSKKKDEVKPDAADPDMRKAVLIAERLLGLIEPAPSISDRCKNSMRSVVEELNSLLEQATAGSENTDLEQRVA